MDALVMCGGRGTRFDAPAEKPLYPVGGEPMVDRVRAALDGTERVEAVHAAVSPNAPDTRTHLDGRVDLIETPGDGYVADLRAAVERLDGPVLSVAADLPLLAPGPLDRIVATADADSLAVLAPAALKRALGVGVDGDGPWVPTGVNVIGASGRDATLRTWDARLAVNVNRGRDARVAESLLVGDGDPEPG